MVGAGAPRDDADRAARALRASFVVPAHNAAKTLPATIASIRAAAPGSEIVVIDDGSLDDTREVAEALLGHPPLSRPCQGGAARSRNDAARVATGDVLLFVDADVTVTPAAVAGLLRHIEDGADAAFGSYTALPPVGYRNAPTTFKNLVHHYTHQSGGTDHARPVWSGVGGGRTAAVFPLGGFDPAVTRRARRG